MRIQKNELFEVIGRRGLQPTEFTLSNDEDEYTRVLHLSTGSLFTIASVDGNTFYGSLKIGAHGGFPYDSAYWHIVQNIFSSWLADVKIEAESPDMWDKLRRARAVLSETQHEGYGNTLFTVDEQAQISNQLREIKELIKRTPSLSDEKFALIEARLDEAEEASHRIGRKDWRLLFCGLIFTLIITDLVPPDVAQHILMMTFHGLVHLFGINGRPQLPPQA